VFTARQYFNDAQPNGLGKDFEDVHAFTMSVRRDVTAN
jgi:hypothetical protein